MRGGLALLRKEWLEARRTNRLLIVSVIFLFFGFSSPLLARYLPELLQLVGTAGVQIIVPAPTTKDAVEQFLKNLGNGALLGVLLTMGAVAREKERGTIAFVLAKPIGRAPFLLAKFAALTAIFLVGFVLAGMAMYWYTAVLFAVLPVGGFVAGCLLAWLATLVYVAVTFLGSTLARSVLPAGGVGIVALLLFTLLGSLPRLARFTPSGLFAAARALVLGETPTDLGAALLANGLVIGVALVLSWWAFRRQEFAGQG